MQSFTKTLWPVNSYCHNLYANVKIQSKPLELRARLRSSIYDVEIVQY